MADEAVSGQYAVVSGVPSMVSWNVARSRPSVSFKHSGTGGGTNRRRGVGAWTGSWTAKGGVPAMLPGQSGAFVGYGGPSAGDAGGAGFTYSGTIFPTDIEIRWDWTTNTVVEHTVNFVGHLGLTRASAAAITDVSAEAEVETSLCLMKHSAADILSMKSASLKISSDVKSFVNSGTVNETGRRGGSLIDWEAQFVLERADNTLTEGVQGVLHMYVNATQFWSLTYSKFREYSGITANRESGEIISQTAVFEMASNSDVDGVLGQILLPDTTVYWPF